MKTAFGAARTRVGNGERCTAGCVAAQAERVRQRATLLIEDRRLRTNGIDNCELIEDGGPGLTARRELTASCEPSSKLVLVLVLDQSAIVDAVGPEPASSLLPPR